MKTKQNLIRQIRSGRTLRPTPSRPFSDGSSAAVRYSDYVYDQLYHPEKGYFAKQSGTQLGRLSSPIPFNRLMGYSDYTEHLAANYPANQFLTPSEIFRPFYGMTLANLIYKTMLKEGITEIDIVEIGSGMGGNACSILDFFRVKAPQLYSRLRYFLVDISPVAIQFSKKFLTTEHKSLVAAGRIQWVNKDILEANIRIDRPCFVVTMEILDNLKHEKLRISQDLRRVDECWIDRSTAGTPVEVYKPLSSGSTAQVLDLWKKLYAPNGSVDLRLLQKISKKDKVWQKVGGWVGQAKDLEIYLPVGFYEILQGLQRTLKNSRWIISDFSSLPIGRPLKTGVIEVNPPIVQTKLEKSHEVQEFESILVPEFGSADVFYPTDFSLVQQILTSIQNKPYLVDMPDVFFSRHAEISWANTRSGYNPMKEDFQNTRFVSPDF